MSRFQETAERAFGTVELFEGPKFEHRKEASRPAFESLAPLGGRFLDVVKGRRQSLGSRPPVGRSICFPERFLRTRSVDQLGSPVAEQLSEILDRTFFNGLLFHLFTASFPTRDRIPDLNVSALEDEWSINALVASRVMRDYDKEAGGEPSLVFRSLFNEKIEPYPKNVLRVGIWNRGKARSNLKNLYFAGALLGMIADIATRDL